MRELPESLKKYKAEIEQGLQAAKRRAGEFALMQETISRGRNASPVTAGYRRDGEPCFSNPGQGKELPSIPPDPGQETLRQKIKFWPIMGIMANKHNNGGAWRVYVLAKHLDMPGRGAIAEAELEVYMTKLRIAPRSWRRWIHQARAMGLLKEISKQDIPWYVLASHQAAAIAMGCDYIGTRPAMTDAASLFGPGWRSIVWAAYEQTHQGRPISRQTQENITGVPASTQRAYDNQAHVIRTADYCLTGLSPDHLAGEQEINGRPGAFIWKYRKHGKTYEQVAYRLPDSRQANHVADAINRGRSKKINKAIRQQADRLFIMQQARSSSCMSEGPYLRIFNKSATEARAQLRKAIKADISQDQGPQEIYLRHRSIKRADLWQAIPIGG